MKQNSVFLRNGTFTQRKFDKILIASLAGWFLSLIDSCADSLLAGALLDEMAVSAISLVQPVASVISFVAYLVSVGTAVMFSIESGAFRKDKANQIVGQGVICSIVLSVVLVLAMIIARDPLMAFYGASEELTALAKEYYMCEIFFAAVYPIYFLIYQLVVVDGDEAFSFLACAAGAVGNIVASLVLVGPLGVKGLALGTVIGTVVAILVYCIHFLRKTNSVHAKLHFDTHDFFDVVKISSSTAMTLLYVAVIDIIMNKFIISVYSDIYLPAYAVVNFLLNLGAVYCCFHDANTGFVSVAYGENNPAGIKQAMNISYRALIIVSILSVVLFEFVAPYSPDLYSITDPAVREATVFATRVIALSCPATAFYYLFCTYYPSVGYVSLGHVISIIYMLIAPLILAIPLGLAYGFKGMAVGFALTSIVAILDTAIVVWIKYGKKAVPLVLQDTDEEFVSYELRLTETNISALCEKVSAELNSRNVDSSIANEISLVLEESYMTIMEENSGKKVMTECDILLSDKMIRVITRDNGKIFDITDANARVKDLRSYVLAELMEHNPGRTNTTTISFNRNSYFWKLQEE